MRCAITGGDGGDLIGSELTIVTDDVYGLAWLFDEATAARLVTLVNTQELGCISFDGEDGGDLMGTPLLNLCLDGQHVGWAQEEWLSLAN